MTIVNLGQGILGDSLKCLLDVDCLLGRSLKVGDFVLGVAPLLRSLRRYCAVVQVNLQSDTVCEHKI